MSAPEDASCEVIGCWLPTTAVYLVPLAEEAVLLEFGICAGHFAALEAGGQPQLVQSVNNGRQWSQPRLIVS